MKRFTTRVAIVVGLVCALMAPAVEADEPILIRFSHVVSEPTPKGIGAQLFKERAEARFPGRVTVEVYPRSQKFTDDEVLLAMLFGDIEMAAPSLSKFRSFAPELQVFDLPFLFRDIEHIHRFQRSVVGRQLLQTLLPRDLQGLTYWDNGFRAVSADRPVRVPEDVDGLTFRVEDSAVFMAQWAQVGVLGIPMPFSRLTDAIREGIVDGQENAWSNIYSRGIQDLQKNFLDLRDSYLGYMVVTRQDFWAALPADVRTGLEEILAEVTVEVNRISAEQSQTARAGVAATEGVVIVDPTPSELEQWRESFLPMWGLFSEEIGVDVIDAAISAGQE